jgi:uncharacterized protein (DUF1501 family)
MPFITRRKFLINSAALGCAAMMYRPGLSFAFANTDQRLMVIIMRGGMDGMGAIAPVGDPNYHDARGGLALPDNVLLPMGGIFAMHNSMAPLHALYQQKEMLVLHATATPYRERSHFDAQDLLENGSVQPHALTTGWLGRTLQTLGTNWHGLAVGPVVPLVMQGSGEVESWAPSHLKGVDADFISRMQYMYQHDAQLGAALAEANQLNTDGGNMSGEKGKQDFPEMMTTAASFMSKANGPRIATIDITGWDTHAGQGTEKGRLPQALENLSAGITAFRTGMGPLWQQTAVIAVTEFGRTVHANGTGGSDHGTGTAAFLLGGKVQGGRVVGDWPGLASNQLYQERDLYPANDLRGLLKSVLTQHLQLPEAQLDAEIFPQSQNIRAMSGIFS